MDNWQVMSFKDAPLEIIDGDRGTNYPSQHEFSPNGYCLFLNAGNVTKNGFAFVNCAFVTREKDDVLRKGKLIRNDVVLTTRGTVGNTAYYNDGVPFENVRINSGMVILRARPAALDPLYLYLFVRSAFFQTQVSSLLTGSAQPQLPIRDINKIEIPIPPPNEQRAIASILGAFDDKIHVNRLTNEALEAMASTIFKDWFVDFGPTVAKIEGQAPYLSPDVWAMFPDRLSVEGRPDGWGLCPLSSIASIARDVVTPVSHAEELFDHYSIPAFDNGKTPVRELGIGILSNKTVIPAGAILLSKLNPGTLRVWLVDANSGVRSVCSTEFLVYLPRLSADRAFIYSLMSENSFRQRLVSMVTGTSSSHQRVNLQSVSALNTISAPRPVMDAFHTLAGPLLARGAACLRESRSLAATRDLLVPKLMTGEIPIKSAVKIAEAAL